MMKVLKKMLAVAVSVATMAMSVSAFAATYKDQAVKLEQTEYTDKLTAKLKADKILADGQELAEVLNNTQMTVVVVSEDFGSENGDNNIYYINQEEFGTKFNDIITNMGLKDELDTPANYQVRVGGTKLSAPVTFDITVEGGEITVKYGDVNEDTFITITDANDLMRFLISEIELSANQQKASDVNADTFVTITDANDIMRFLVNEINDFTANNQ